MTGFDSKSPGTKKITIKIGTKTTSYNVNILSIVLKELTITKPASKLSYLVGDDLNISGIELTGLYNNGSIKPVQILASDTYGFESRKAGTKTVTINVDEVKVSYDVTVKDIDLTDLVITTPASKLNYLIGDSLSLYGLIVSGTYNNGITKSEIIPASNITGFDSKTSGVKKITLTVGNKSVSYEVKVDEPTLAGIDIRKSASKLSFFIGEELDTTGLEVESIYNNGTRKLEVLSPSAIQGFDSKTIGTKTITVTLYNKTVTYKVKVTGRPDKIVFAGHNNSAIITSYGALYTFGDNKYGQLGDGTKINRNTPVKVMEGVANVALGWDYTLIIKKDSSLWGVGSEGNGVFGNNCEKTSKIDYTTPIKLMDDVSNVFTGWGTTFILKKDGTLLACGSNFGKYGNGSVGSESKPITVLTNVKSASISMGHSLAVKNDGTLWATGDNYLNEFGNGTKKDSLVWLKILDNVENAIAGFRWSSILKKDGTVWAVGENDTGQLGDGTSTNRALPVQIMSGVSTINGLEEHYFMLTNNGTLFGVGSNFYGIYGTGDSSRSRNPNYLTDNVASISAGFTHSIIQKKDGTIWTTGNNENGELGNGTTIDSYLFKKIMD